MAGPIPTASLAAAPATDRSTVARPSPVARIILTALAVAFLALFVLVPLANVFAQAFSKGFSGYLAAFHAPTVSNLMSLPRHERLQIERAQTQAKRTWSAVRMTLCIAAVAVPANTVFGIAAAWLIAKFRFRGRAILISLIDLPFSVSPVVAGLIFVLLVGRTGWLGDWGTNFKWVFPSLTWRGFSGHVWPFGFELSHYTGIIFTPLGMMIATAFVTFPFVARTLIPLMEAQGADEELAAATLGAGGWQTFRRVTLPNIRWGLLYGIILCNARAMGEFGAVSVVGGQLDDNNTIPLRVEALYQEPGNLQAAFAVATLLAMLAIITLIVKSFMEWKARRDLVAAGR